MPPALATDPILKRFRAALDESYGDRLERVVLFGSRARGDAGEDSHYDIAVFLKDLKEGDLGTRWGGRGGRPRARGDAGEDSDYDIAVFLKDLKEGDLDTRWRELARLADLRSAILFETD